MQWSKNITLSIMPPHNNEIDSIHHNILKSQVQQRRPLGPISGTISISKQYYNILGKEEDKSK
jgi:hypothetical protein